MSDSLLLAGDGALLLAGDGDLLLAPDGGGANLFLFALLTQHGLDAPQPSGNDAGGRIDQGFSNQGPNYDAFYPYDHQKVWTVTLPSAYNATGIRTQLRLFALQNNPFVYGIAFKRLTVGGTLALQTYGAETRVTLTPNATNRTFTGQADVSHADCGSPAPGDVLDVRVTRYVSDPADLNTSGTWWFSAIGQNLT